MANLADILNNVNCGAGDVLGTGTKNCRKDIKQVKTIGLTERGYKFKDGDLDTIAGLQALQQKGKLIILQGVVEFTDATADDNIVTRTGSGEKVVAGKNPYEYSVTFDNGLAFHKAISHLSSHRQYDMVVWDSLGDVILTQTKAGEAKGLTLGMFEAGKYMVSNGADAASQSVSFQWINRDEFDQRVSYIVSENLDYSYEDLDGYNDATIGLTAPADGATTVSFEVSTTADNHKVSISGLEVSDFLYKVNGATVIPTLLTEGAGNGLYVLTVPALAAADEITLEFFDGTANASIINVDGILYKSNIANAITTA